MALTYSSPRGTYPPRRSATNDDPTSKRKPEADDGRVDQLNPSEAKVDDEDITRSHDSRTMANIAKTDRGPNGPERGSDTSSPPKTPARQLVSVDLTFNTESV